MCGICSKLTKNKAEQRQWGCSSAFIVNFEQISHVVLLNLSNLIYFQLQIIQQNPKWWFASCSWFVKFCHEIHDIHLVNDLQLISFFLTDRKPLSLLILWLIFLLCRSNQCTGFCTIGNSVMKEWNKLKFRQLKIYLAWKNKALFFLGWRKLFSRKKNTVADYRTKSNSCFATPDWDYIQCRSFSTFVSFISVKIRVEPIKIWNNQNILYCKFRSTLYRNLKWQHLSRIEEMKWRKLKPF